MQWIGRAWRGEEKLWKVFWIYGAVLAVVIYIIGYITAKLLINYPTSRLVDAHHVGEPLGYLFLWLAFSFSFVVIGSACWCIAIWKNANNTQIVLFFYLSKIFAILALIFIVAGSEFVESSIDFPVISVAQLGMDILLHPADVQACREQPHAPRPFPPLHDCVQNRLQK